VSAYENCTAELSEILDYDYLLVEETIVIVGNRGL